MSEKTWQTVATLISEMHAGDHGPGYSLIERDVPEGLETDDVRGLRLVGREVTAYRAALMALMADPLVEHLTEREVDGFLWRFVCRVHLGHLGRDPRSRRSLAEEFVASVQQPWKPYVVMVQMAGLHPNLSGLSFAGLEFVKPTPTVLAEWGLGRSPAGLRWKGTVAVRSTIEAGSPSIAADRAAAKVAILRDVLRLSLQESIRVRLYNEQLKFESGWIAVREPEGKWKHVRSGWVSIAQDRWPRASVVRALSSVEPLERLGAGGRPALADLIARAIAWASRSRDTSNPAFALFALTASLEALLGESSAKSKGSLLALRSMLLEVRTDGHFRDPGDVLTLYEARSRLVHGAQPEVNDELVWHLRGISERAIFAALRLLDENPHARTRKDWVALLETPELLRLTVQQLRGIDAEPYKSMVARAESLLADHDLHSSASVR